MKNKLAIGLLLATAGAWAAAFSYLPHFEQPSFFSAMLEGALVAVAWVIIWKLRQYPVNSRFHFYLTGGFVLLYTSLLVDFLDEFFFQPNWLATMEELTLLSGFLLTTYGIYLATRYHYEQIQQLEKLAQTDSLTGLLNRRAIIQRLEQQTQIGQQDPSHHFSVVVADIDRFKDINDRFGHNTGDAVLQQIARSLNSGLRSSDFIGRWGGEEFIILLPQTREDGAALVAEKIRQHIGGKSFTVDGQRIDLSISLGVAQWQPEQDNWGEVVKHADQAMYLAKRSGRNRVRTASQIRQSMPDSLLSDPA